MKIFFYSHDYYKGGIDTFLINLLRKLHDKTNYELILCTSIFHPSTNFIKSKIPNSIKVKKLYLFDISDFSYLVDIYISNIFLKKILNKIILLLKFPLFVINTFFLTFITLVINPKLFFLVSGGFPSTDIIKSFILVKKFLSNFINLKLIFNFHNYPVKFNKSKFKKKYERYIANFIFNNSDNLITVSKSVVDSLSFYKLNKIQLSKLCFIHNGIDPLTMSNTINSKEIKLKYDIPLNCKIHLIIGTLEERKGHKFLLNIFKKVIQKNPNNHLVICGHGLPNEILEINKLIILNNLQNHCSLKGFVESIEEIFSITDFLLIGSQSGESFGLPAIEAMSLKIPFLSSDFGGLGEIIIDGNGGYKSSYKDIDAFFAKLNYLHSLNNIELNNLKNKGFLYYQNNFTSEIMTNKYIDFIK